MVASGGIAVQDFLEPSEELRDAVLAEILGPAERDVLLVFVVEVSRYRMVSVMRFVHQIRDGELDLLGPDAAGRIPGREIMLGAEIEQDRRRLADQQIAGA